MFYFMWVAPCLPHLLPAEHDRSPCCDCERRPRRDCAPGCQVFMEEAGREKCLRLLFVNSHRKVSSQASFALVQKAEAPAGKVRKEEAFGELSG